MNKIFLPNIFKNFYAKPTLGAHVVNPNSTKMQYAVEGQHVGWVIEYNKIDCRVKADDVLVLDWSMYDKQFEAIKDYPRWIQVKYTPEFMRSIPELPCSPPLPEYWLEFTGFVIEVIRRYKPFAIEIWNEPEVTVEEVQNSEDMWSSIFGCWDSGTYFGEFIKFVYDYAKPNFPNITFMGGALMLESESHFVFAEEMCKTGKFDVLSFHNYSFNRNYNRPFEKSERLRAILDSNKKNKIPIWLSETAYRWSDNWGEIPSSFEWEQSYYLENLYKNAIKHHIRHISYYTLALNGWDHTDLVQYDENRNHIKQLAWFKFKDFLLKT